MFRSSCYTQPLWQSSYLGENMEKTETTIFVDWENLLADLKAIQEMDESFTEAEPRIKGNKNKELEEYKKNNFKEYEKRVNESGIIQSFNHAIAQQNQVKLRVGRVMFKFTNESEDKEVYDLEAKIPIPQLDLRQKTN